MEVFALERFRVGVNLLSAIQGFVLESNPRACGFDLPGFRQIRHGPVGGDTAWACGGFAMQWRSVFLFLRQGDRLNMSTLLSRSKAVAPYDVNSMPLGRTGDRTV